MNQSTPVSATPDATAAHSHGDVRLSNMTEAKAAAVARPAASISATGRLSPDAPQLAGRVARNPIAKAPAASAKTPAIRRDRFVVGASMRAP
jgi:hypothetical protein